MLLHVENEIRPLSRTEAMHVDVYKTRSHEVGTLHWYLFTDRRTLPRYGHYPRAIHQNVDGSVLLQDAAGQHGTLSFYQQHRCRSGGVASAWVELAAFIIASYPGVASAWGRGYIHHGCRSEVGAVVGSSQRQTHLWSRTTGEPVPVRVRCSAGAVRGSVERESWGERDALPGY